MTDEAFDRTVEELFETFVERHPVTATYMGLHRYDGELGSTSREFIQEDIAILQRFRRRVEDLPEGALTGGRPLDRSHVLFFADLNLFQLQEVRHWESVPAGGEALGAALFPLITRDFAPLEERMESIASRLHQAPRYLEEIRTRLDRPVKLWVEMALEAAERLPGFLEVIDRTAGEKLTGEVVNRLHAAQEEAAAALEEYQDWLRTDLLPDAQEDYAVGGEALARMMEIRQLGYDPDGVRELGVRYLEEAKTELQRVAETLDPEATVSEVSRRIRSDHPPTFPEVLESVRNVVQEARSFVEEERLATLPPAERLIVTETPPFLRPVLPFAAYFRPPRFEEVQEGMYIVTPPSDGEEMLREHNHASTRNTVVHEGYPGHHLQLSAANRNPSLARALPLGVGFAETAEGWAHYCEDLMRETGFNDTPEIRFVQLQDTIWRACRIIIDVDLHRGRMDFDEAVDMLVAETDMERPSAVAEVKRYTQNPTYQLSYLLGKHLIQGLREEVEDRMGDRFTLAFFHDAILYAGNLPFFLLRRAVEDRLAALEEGVEDLY